MSELTGEALEFMRERCEEAECVECEVEVLAAPDEEEPRCIDCAAVVA